MSMMSCWNSNTSVVKGKSSECGTSRSIDIVDNFITYFNIEALKYWMYCSKLDFQWIGHWNIMERKLIHFDVASSCEFYSIKCLRIKTNAGFQVSVCQYNEQDKDYFVSASK